MTYNLAKCGFHEGGVSFASVDTVRARLARLAAAIAREDCDLVFLTEAVFEAGPCPVDQVDELARAGGFAFHASGENYSFGLPFFRVRSGNAILSRVALTPVEVRALPGARPFWSPTDNRRTLWCSVELDGVAVLVGAVRNESRDDRLNDLQMASVLEFVGARDAILAGDFNAEPGSAAVRRLDGRFSGATAGDATFPVGAPARRLDYVLAPRAWTLIEERVVDLGVSDHLAVVATFALD